jgi:hypothetical protein
MKDLVFPDGKKKCSDWFTKFAFSNSMALVTAAVVEIVNEIVVLILVWTSKFQRYKNKTEELAHSVPKILFFQFINTALLILIVNAKVPELNVPSNFPLLNGNYVDFTVSWYRNVGTTLTIAMIMNIITLRTCSSCYRLFYAASTEDARETLERLGKCCRKIMKHCILGRNSNLR